MPFVGSDDRLGMEQHFIDDVALCDSAVEDRDLRPRAMAFLAVDLGNGVAEAPGECTRLRCVHRRPGKDQNLVIEKGAMNGRGGVRVPR